MNREYAEQAARFVDAIRAITQDEEKLNALEWYLSIHFPRVCDRMTEPDSVVQEMEWFAGI